MYTKVYTLKGTERAGTFAEPYSICPASSRHHTQKHQLQSFFVSDITNQRIVKVERIDDRERIHSSKGKGTKQNSEWACTVVSPKDRLLYIPRGLCAVPHAHTKHGLIRQAVTGDVIVVVDSGHNRIRALSVASNLRDGLVGETPYINVAGSGQKGCADESGFKATFNHPHAACFLADGSLLVTDTRNHRVRRLAPDKTKVRNIAGSQQQQEQERNAEPAVQFSPVARTSAHRRHNQRRPLNYPSSTTTRTPSLSLMLLQWSVGERKEQHNHPTHAMRASIAVTTIAGSTKGGLKDGLPGDSLLCKPTGIACCPTSGVVIVCDSGNHCLRLLHPTRDSNSFYVSTLEVAMAGTGTDHTGTAGNTSESSGNSSLRPFHIHNPSNITVLNGDGTAEVIAVTHDHGVSVVAIDVKSSVVLGCESVAGRTRRQKEAAATEKAEKETAAAAATAAAAGGNTTVPSHPMFNTTRKSASSVAAMKLEFGYVDGAPKRSKFHRPAGILLGHNSSLYVCDSKNASIRHLMAGTVTAEKFWTTTARSSPRRRASFIMNSTTEEGMKEAKPGLQEQQVATAKEKKEKAERELLDAAMKRRHKKKSIGSHLANAWSTGKNVQDAYIADIKNTLGDPQKLESAEKEEKINKNTKNAKNTKNTKNTKNSARRNSLRRSASSSRKSNNSRNAVMRRVDSARGWRVPSTPQPVTRTGSMKGGPPSIGTVGSFGFGSSSRSIGTDTLEYAKVQSPSIRSAAGSAAGSGSTAAAAAATETTVALRALERTMSERFVGLGRNVQRSKMEKREAKKTIQRLSTMESRRTKERKVLKRGEGMTASTSRIAERVLALNHDGSDESSSLQQSRTRQQQTSSSQSHQHAMGLDTTQGLILKLHPRRSSFAVNISQMEDTRQPVVIESKQPTKQQQKQRRNRRRRASSSSNRNNNVGKTGPIKARPLAAFNSNTTVSTAPREAAESAMESEAPDMTIHKYHPTSRHPEKVTTPMNNTMKSTSSWRAPKTPRSQAADHLRLRKLSMAGYPTLNSRGRWRTTAATADRPMNKSDMDADDDVPPPPFVPAAAAAAAIPLPTASAPAYTPSFMRSTSTSRRKSITSGKKEKQHERNTSRTTKLMVNTPSSESVLHYSRGAKVIRQTTGKKVNDDSMNAAAREVLHINRGGNITVNTLGESGSIVMRTPARSPQQEVDLMRLIGSAQRKAERLMLMVRNQV